MNAPLTLAQILEPWFSLTGAKASVIPEGWTDDSREVKSGWVFVARGGSTMDGAQFIQKAQASGALVTIGRPGSGAEIEISDLDHKIPELLDRAYQKPQDTVKLVAVTGTNGKTTTAFVLHHILQAWSGACALTGTVCQRFGWQESPSQLTTPGIFGFYRLLDQARSQKMKYLVFEASSHALHQGRLGKLQVEAAIFTNLSQDHLDYHGTFEEYFAAKTLLFSQHLSPTGLAVIHIGDSWGQTLANQLRSLQIPVCTTAARPEIPADWTLLDQGQNPLVPELAITGPEIRLNTTTLLPGDFNRENIIGSLAALHHLGVPTEILVEELPKVTVPGRLQKIPHAQLHVFVDYAHTPDALERVLKSLRPLCQGKLACVFGCGGDRDRTKRPLMAQAVERGADKIYVTSDNPRTESPEQILLDVVAGLSPQAQSQAVVEIDRRIAIQKAIQDLGSQDILLIAGKGHEDYQILGTTKHPFDDRLEAQRALETLK
jgi:UDP-N-acetylmuramoyl-L-alanyl-D-glutamate--2,6-diaminopimelate ligase